MQNRIFNSIISAFLSLITPGLGQIRNNQITKGIIFYSLEYILLLIFIFMGIFKTFNGLLIALLIWICLLVFIIIDAFIIAYRSADQTPKFSKQWIIYITIILLNILFSLSFKSYITSNFIGTYIIPTPTMQPTLFVGDYLISDNKYFQNNPVNPGDIIIFKYPKNQDLAFIKRCIALGGQTIEIIDRKVFVNGKPFQESTNVQFLDEKIYPQDYIEPRIFPDYAGNRDNYGPITVPENNCFVLGDSRDNSSDSRYWGFVPYNLIIGKPLYIFWANDKNRIGKSIK